MKIDQEYLKGLLDAFQSAESSVTTIDELKLRGFSFEEETFVFHLSILADRNLVEQESGSDLGFRRAPDGHTHWNVVHLRLTATGHDFVEALRNNKIWETIKLEFKDASIGTLLRVSKGMLEGFTKKKVTELIAQNE
jgi:hypothetical protein